MKRRLIPLISFLIWSVNVSVGQEVRVFCNKTLETKIEALSRYYKDLTQTEFKGFDTVDYDDVSVMNNEFWEKFNSALSYKNRINRGQSENLPSIYELLLNIPVQEHDFFWFKQQYFIHTGKNLDDIFGYVGASAIIEDESKNLWFKTGEINLKYPFEVGSLLKYENEKVNLELPEYAVSAFTTKVFTDSKNRIWQIHKSGFSWFDGQEWKQYSDKQLNFAEGGWYIDKKGTVWIFAAGNKIFGITENEIKTYNVETKNGFYFPNKGELKVIEDGENYYWLKVNNPTVAKITTSVLFFNGENWKLLTKKDGLPLKSIGDMELNKNGRIMICGSGGLYLHGGAEKWFPIPAASAKSLNSFHRGTDEELWIEGGTYNGKFFLTDDKLSSVQKYDLPSRMSDHFKSRIMYDSDGRMWLHNPKSRLIYFQNGKFSENYSTVIRNEIDAEKGVFNKDFLEIICEDGSKKLWIGLGGNLFFFEQNKWIHHPFPDVNELHPKIYLKKDNNDNLWVTRLRFKDGNNEWSFYKNVKGEWQELFSINASDLYYDNKLQVVFEDSNGNVWFGFKYGIVQLISN